MSGLFKWKEIIYALSCCMILNKRNINLEDNENTVGELSSSCISVGHKCREKKSDCIISLRFVLLCDPRGALRLSILTLIQLTHYAAAQSSVHSLTLATVGALLLLTLCPLTNYSFRALL